MKALTFGKMIFIALRGLPASVAVAGHVRRVPRRLALCVVVAVTLVGCAVGTPDIYKGYPGQARQAAEISIVRGKSAGLHEVDGESLKHPDPSKYYHEAHLLPGAHTVTLIRDFSVSILLVPGGRITASKSFLVIMEAGHVYELHADRTTGPGFRVYLWIEDARTGELVAGQKLY